MLRETSITVIKVITVFSLLGGLVACGSSEPDQIAFSYAGEPNFDFDEEREIYVMDADGSNVRQLTTNDDYDGAPAWSPDGKQIASPIVSGVMAMLRFL